MMITIDIPLDLAESIAGAIYAHADFYRRDTAHVDPEDAVALRESADRMDAIAEEIGTRAGRMEADLRSAKMRARGGL